MDNKDQTVIKAYISPIQKTIREAASYMWDVKDQFPNHKVVLVYNHVEIEIESTEGPNAENVDSIIAKYNSVSELLGGGS